MRKLLGTIGIAAVLAAMTTPSFSMGGGGGGGGYGGGGGGMGSTGSFDDYTLAVRMIKHEKYADAVPHLLMALAAKPGNADILNYLGYSKRMLGDYQASLGYYNAALAKDPNHKGVHEYLGELYLQMHDLPKAQTELATLTTLCPSGCDERDTLTKSIAAYVPPPADAAAPAAAAPTSGGVAGGG